MFSVFDKSAIIDISALSKCHNRKVLRATLVSKKNLHAMNSKSERTTLLLELQSDDGFTYEPGDHVGVFPCNRQELVDGIIGHLTLSIDPDTSVELQILKEKQSSTGKKDDANSTYY